MHFQTEGGQMLVARYTFYHHLGILFFTAHVLSSSQKEMMTNGKIYKLKFPSSLHTEQTNCRPLSTDTVYAKSFPSRFVNFFTLPLKFDPGNSTEKPVYSGAFITNIIASC